MTAVMDASGAVLERYHYTAFGTVTVLDADFSGDADGVSDLGNEVTFPGRRLDGETGLFYFRNRMYHAQLGLFIGRDPAGYVDGMSLYGGYFVPGGMDPFGLGYHTANAILDGFDQRGVKYRRATTGTYFNQTYSEAGKEAAKLTGNMLKEAGAEGALSLAVSECAEKRFFDKTVNNSIFFLTR